MNADIFSNLDTCGRKTRWNDSWESIRLRPTEMLYRALKVALASDREDAGECAGEEVMTLAAARGIDSKHHNLYDIGLHHASLADILATHLRPEGSPVWLIPAEKDGWRSGCYLAPDGSHLRRVILVRDWDDDRLLSECRSWRTMAEMATYQLPMVLYVLVLGQNKADKRYSAWTQCSLHPRIPSRPRFQKKNRTLKPRNYGEIPRTLGTSFGDTWTTIFREDRSDIPRERWLEAMEDDGMFKQLSLRHKIELPAAAKLKEVRRDMAEAAKDFDRAVNGRLPRKRYSGCHWPVECPFVSCCWNEKETEPSENNFYSIKSLDPIASVTT